MNSKIKKFAAGAALLVAGKLRADAVAQDMADEYFWNNAPGGTNTESAKVVFHNLEMIGLSTDDNDADAEYFMKIPFMSQVDQAMRDIPPERLVDWNNPNLPSAAHDQIMRPGFINIGDLYVRESIAAMLDGGSNVEIGDVYKLEIPRGMESKKSIPVEGLYSYGETIENDAGTTIAAPRLPFSSLAEIKTLGERPMGLVRLMINAEKFADKAAKETVEYKRVQLEQFWHSKDQSFQIKRDRSEKTTDRNLVIAKAMRDSMLKR